MTTQYHIQAEGLTRTFRVPVKQPGLTAAFTNLMKRSFNIVEAVNDVSFNIEKGEMIGFIGPNGAGKTTTLKMLSGLLYPTSGSAVAAGFTPWKRKSQYLKKISMLMGNRNQMSWNITVIDNMHVFKEIFSVSSQDFNKHLSELSEMFDIGKLMQKQVRNLSLGERSKCEFATALLHKPEILYLDEPTLGMDVTMQLRLRQYIKEYNQKFGATVILTSHYMSDITALCPRLMMINNGKLTYDGKLTELTERFSPYKIIKLNIDDSLSLEQEDLDEAELPAEITANEGNEYILRTKKEDVIKVSSQLMSLYNPLDFNITDPPIEAIIDRIYTNSDDSVTPGDDPTTSVTTTSVEEPS